ncbi:MAG: hypothetical protein ACI4DY_15245 [Monoglobaceae bacterium]
MTQKTVFSKITAIILCILTLVSFSAITASAATSGGSRSATVYVTTKSNYFYPGSSSVTLKQEKQTLTYQQLFGAKTKTKTGYYGCYDINVYNVTKKTSKSVYWGGGRTKKISLDANCAYRITVCYNSTATSLFTRAPLGYSLKKTSNPGWSISSTWKVSSVS